MKHRTRLETITDAHILLTPHFPHASQAPAAFRNMAAFSATMQSLIKLNWPWGSPAMLRPEGHPTTGMEKACFIQLLLTRNKSSDKRLPAHGRRKTSETAYLGWATGEQTTPYVSFLLCSWLTHTPRPVWHTADTLSFSLLVHPTHMTTENQPVWRHC